MFCRHRAEKPGSVALFTAFAAQIVYSCSRRRFQNPIGEDSSWSIEGWMIWKKRKFLLSDVYCDFKFWRLDDVFSLSKNCVTRAPLLYFIRSWVALSFKIVSLSVSEWGIGNTCPDLHFVQYIKAWVSSTDPVSSITNCYRLIVSYTDPVHSFIIS